MNLGESSVARAQLSISAQFELSPSYVRLVYTIDNISKQIQRQEGRYSCACLKMVARSVCANVSQLVVGAC
jgi:hypothetical protein